MKIHDEIDNYLAADLHSDLSDEERNALHVHLVECASCRHAHQENKIMNKVLEEKFANERPDVAFEQRMLAGFRTRIPRRTGDIAKFIVDLMRLRATQITAVAAVLLALVQVGRLITHESVTPAKSFSTAFREDGGQLEKDQRQSATRDLLQRGRNAKAPAAPQIRSERLTAGVGYDKTDARAFAHCLAPSKHHKMAAAKVE